VTHAGIESSDKGFLGTEDGVLLEAHFRRSLGDPFRVLHDVLFHMVHVDIMIFPASEYRPFITLVTHGMSARRMHAPEDRISTDEHLSTTSEHQRPYPQLAELMTYLPADWDFGAPGGDWPALLLLQTASYTHESDDYLAEGHTIARGVPAGPLFEGSLLTTMYMTEPVMELGDFYHFALSDGSLGHIYWVQFLTTAETYICRTEGRHVIDELLRAHQVVALDIDRQCLISPESRKAKRARVRVQRRRGNTPQRLQLVDMPCAAHSGEEVGPQEDNSC